MHSYFVSLPSPTFYSLLCLFYFCFSFNTVPQKENPSPQVRNSSCPADLNAEAASHSATMEDRSDDSNSDVTDDGAVVMEEVEEQERKEAERFD